MLTRGYFIGEIIDAFSDIAGKVSTRNRLGLTDLNRHAEDFFREILNRVYKLSLVNLNEDRSNAPGLDLGDKSRGIAFQVTAQHTSAKVNETLKKLSVEQISLYPKIRVLMIGGKQQSYTLNEPDCTRVGFSEKDIWDVNVLCKRAMNLSVGELQSLYKFIRDELARVRIELEIPDADGNYPTNVADFVEVIPQPRLSDFKKFNLFLSDSGDEVPTDKMSETFAALSKSLAKLPRVTREFLTVMIQRRETDRPAGFGYSDCIEVNVDKLKRILSYPDSDGELRVLQACNFVRYDEPTEHNSSAHWRILFPGVSEELLLSIVQFVEDNGINLVSPLVHLDFGDF